MTEPTSLSMTQVRRAVDAILTEAEKGGRPIAVAVTDERGELVAYAQMDDVVYLPRLIARRKAYTAALMRSDTAALAQRFKEVGRSAAEYGDLNLLAIQGGVVIESDGRTIGAIGISGRSSQEDEDLALLGLRAAGLRD